MFEFTITVSGRLFNMVRTVEGGIVTLACEHATMKSFEGKDSWHLTTKQGEVTIGHFLCDEATARQTLGLYVKKSS